MSRASLDWPDTVRLGRLAHLRSQLTTQPTVAYAVFS